MTAEELFALPDDDRIDRRLIRGRRVERPYPFRSPAHGAVIANLSRLLLNWERPADGAGWVAYGYGCPYRLIRDPDTLIYLDSSVITSALETATAPRGPLIEGIPTLAIEVVDRSDSRAAIVELVDAALDANVPLMWLIDPLDEYVKVHRPGCPSLIVDRDDDLTARFVGPSLSFPVSALFE